MGGITKSIWMFSRLLYFFLIYVHVLYINAIIEQRNFEHKSTVTVIVHSSDRYKKGTNYLDLIDIKNYKEPTKSTNVNLIMFTLNSFELNRHFGTVNTIKIHKIFRSSGRPSGQDNTHRISDRSPGPCFQPHEPSPHPSPPPHHSISIRSNLILFSDLHRAVEQAVFSRSVPTQRLVAFHNGK